MGRGRDDRTCGAAGGGRYSVTFHVEARKLRSDSAGNDTEVPMDDLVEIGLFGEDPDKPLYLGKHRLRSGAQTITMTVAAHPAQAVIDPYHKLIVRHSEALHDTDVKYAKV